jgi:hypothetical protein
MIVEFGNHASRSGDDRPKVTTVHVPEADEHGLGGYSHKVGTLSVDDFKTHRQESNDFRDGITRLPDHEALLSITAAWPAHATARPEWVNVIPTDLTPDGHSEDIQKFLQNFYKIDKVKPDNVEELYHTKFGPPGEGPQPGEVVLPKIDNAGVFTNDGRTQQAVNYGGGQVGAIGAGTAATSTSLTTNLTLVTNAWAGYRVYCYSTTSNNIVWANVISNTNAAGASVLTVDRWYVAATPGGTAGTTPTTPWAFILADGGSTSAWFVGLTVTSVAGAATDHALSGEYVVASGGMIRRIAPYSLTSGTSPMSFTLTPVFTVNASDSGLPLTFLSYGVFNSMVVGDTTLAMKFEGLMNASATVSAVSDQLTLTETISGS